MNEDKNDKTIFLNIKGHRRFLYTYLSLENLLMKVKTS